MPRQSKTLPARKQAEEESVLIRSAESLGRMIGALQRQLDGAGKRLAASADGVMSALPLMGEGDAPAGGPRTKRSATRRPKGASPRKAKGAQKSGAAKGRSTGRRASNSTASRAAKRTAKPATAKKTAGRRSAAGRKSTRRAARGR